MVLVESGHTYERDMIKEWLDAGHTTDPLTGSQLSTALLCPNHLVRRMAQEFREKYFPKATENPYKALQAPDSPVLSLHESTSTLSGNPEDGWEGEVPGIHEDTEDNVDESEQLRVFGEAEAEEMRSRDVSTWSREQIIADVESFQCPSYASVYHLPYQSADPLIKAATLGLANYTQALLCSGSDVNVGDEDGDTALHWAAFYNFPEVVKVLLESGADSGAVGQRMCTALFYGSGYPEVVQEFAAYEERKMWSQEPLAAVL